jgi:hypothetical protein
MARCSRGGAPFLPNGQQLADFVYFCAASAQPVEIRKGFALFARL